MKLLWINTALFTVVMLVLLALEYHALATYRFYKCISVRFSKKSMCVEYVSDDVSYFAQMPRDLYIKTKNIRDYGLYYNKEGMPQLACLRCNSITQSVAFTAAAIFVLASYTDIFTYYFLQVLGIIIFIADTILDMKKSCVYDIAAIEEEDRDLCGGLFTLCFYDSSYTKPAYITMNILAFVAVVIGALLLYTTPNGSTVNYEFQKICSDVPYVLYPVLIKNIILTDLTNSDMLIQSVTQSMVVYLYNLFLLVYVRKIFPWDYVWYHKYKSKYLNLIVRDNM